MGFFQCEEYLNLFAKNFCEEKNIMRVEGGAFESVEDEVIFLGMKRVLHGQELSDYGDIVTEEYEDSWKEIVKKLKIDGYRKLRLDYIREDSKSLVILKELGEVIEQEVALSLDLPESWEEYLVSLKGKYRKELKRKLNRLEEVEYEVKKVGKISSSDLGEFVKLHKRSATNKDEFMSEKMEEFFAGLVETNFGNWKVVIDFLEIKGKRVAANLSFENEDEIWLYNSGFDPEYRYYSVGLCLCALTIKRSIEEGKVRYDFLRGGERYKHELGARVKKLYRANIVL